MSADKLFEAMTNAYASGHSLQSTVRDYITLYLDTGWRSETVAESIANTISDYRGSVDSKIEAMMPMEKDDLRRAIKKRDNIINDVSRICREILGYSIVCKSRKHGTYAIKENTGKTPRAKKMVFPADSDGCTLHHYDPSIHCCYPTSDGLLGNILAECKNKFGYDAIDRMHLVPSGVSPDAALICGIATSYGVSLEDLAKHLLSLLKRS